MKKSDLIADVSQAIDVSATKADDVVSTLFEHITNALARNENVNLIGFGRFSVKARPERQGRNPKTGESMTIEAGQSVQFKAGKQLKDAVN